MKNIDLTLGLTLLILIASAFAMGCTENTSASGTDAGADDGVSSFTGDGVQGNIIFDEPVDSFSNATIYLKVKDVSLQDVASVTMSENSITGISMDAGNIQTVPYLIYHPELDERMTYSLSVHVDGDGDGRLSNGDYYSTWHNSVPTGSGMHDLDVHVELI